MTNCKQRDIVLVDFDFSEGTGSKKRPALVISCDIYHEGRQEVIIAAITSNTRRILFGDTKVEHWKDAGLLLPSLVTGIIRTVKDSVIVRKLGVLLYQDFQRAQRNIGKALGL